MKTFFYLLLALSTFSASYGACFAQSPSPLVFDVTEWDFGVIREADGSVTHTFAFTNGGDRPVAIDRVTSSCGCTTPRYTRGPIAPGAKGEISVTFNPENFPGRFDKTVGVVSGGGKQTDFLKVGGEVIPDPAAVEDEFPIEIAKGVRVDKAFVPFRTIAQGQRVMMTVGCVNTSDREVALRFEPAEGSGLENSTGGSGLLRIFAPDTLCAGCRADINLGYDLLADTAYGTRYDVVRPIVDGLPSRTTIYAVMTGVDDFRGVDVDAAPVAAFDRTLHHFGEIGIGAEPYVCRFAVTNDGASTLHIRSVQTRPGLTSTLEAGTAIPPGEAKTFEVALHTGEYFAGALDESVIIVVDDPSRPVREIRIKATLK
ncbi:MAG: DUF1573 domain-containing protein [Alistipes sp.]|nr:DUF1573 domain-containing protein [Alistipes sp.]